MGYEGCFGFCTSRLVSQCKRQLCNAVVSECMTMRRGATSAIELTYLNLEHLGLSGVNGILHRHNHH